MPVFDHHGAQRARLAAAFNGDPTQLTVEATHNRSSALPDGVYRLVATVDCRFKVGGSTVEAAATSHLLPAGEREHLVINTSVGSYLSIVRVGTTDGTADLHWVSS